VSDPGPDYPYELVSSATTMQGTGVRLRPIRPDDAGRLASFHQQLTPGTVYRRYFFLHPVLSDTELEHFTHVDYRTRLAMVAESDGQLVAVGRYERLPGTSDAEVAFLVADEFQHQGIGTILLDRLVDAALSRGITAFVAETLADNHDMIDVFAHSGFPVTTVGEGETVKVRFPIQPEHRLTRAPRTRPTPGAPEVDDPC
jgi:GNAT superfamily N-acetyltransferase